MEDNKFKFIQVSQGEDGKTEITLFEAEGMLHAGLILQCFVKDTNQKYKAISAFRYDEVLSVHVEEKKEDLIPDVPKEDLTNFGETIIVNDNKLEDHPITGLNSDKCI